MTIRKYRSLNPGEQYPLSEKQLRAAFCDTDIHISLGLTPKYVPDSRIPKKQLPPGRVVACLVLNHQEHPLSPGSSAHLSLYAVPSSQWSDRLRSELAERHLPIMRDWIGRKKTLSCGIGGFSWLFITLNETVLSWHELHCM